jgi:polyisoprenoid-binding protein YceI
MRNKSRVNQIFGFIYLPGKGSIMNRPTKTFRAVIHFISVLMLFGLAACAPAAIPYTGATTAPTISTAQNTPAGSGAVTVSASDTAAPTSTAGTEPAVTPGSASTGAIVYTLVPGKNEARYRVREQLADASLPNDAVGRTSQVSGSIAILPDGSIDPASSKFTVNVTSLQTDRSMRDNYVRRNVLNTDQYPDVVFVPTQVSGLTFPLPASGNVQFQLTGDLTIRDATHPVTWDVQGKLENGAATGTATTTFKFEDFGLTQPKVPVVLGVEDHITLEVDVTLQSSSR